ncbi:hypothetical protein FRC01_005698 [Tulasnella sp. 417]|nr:hypothetical protein FRC01_005698 [Tulasnella sp. 417]
MRRVFVQRDNTVVVLTRPTPYRTPGTMGNRLDEANPAWPIGHTEKRLVFVDIPIERQTGAFYVGTYIRHPEKQARFLTTDEFGRLSKELQVELVNLWVAANATPTHRQNALLDIKAGMLSIPCVPLKRVDEEFSGNIDSLLLDALQRDRPSLGRLDLDASGCLYAQDAQERQFHELEIRAFNREFDVEAAIIRRREAANQCKALTAEISRLKTLRMYPSLLEPSADATALSKPSSENKRRRECSESFPNAPNLQSTSLTTGTAPVISNSSALASTSPLLPNVANAVPSPPDPVPQPPEEFLGPFQTYRDLAPVPERMVDGVSVAMINCGYHPRRLARSLRDAILPSRILPPGSDLVRKSIVVSSCRIIWLDKPSSRYHRSRGLLLQNPIPKDDVWDPVLLSDGEKWSVDHVKALLEPYERELYDGTVWHGVYDRIILEEAVQFVSRDDLSDLPLDARISLSQAVPKNLREQIKNMFPEAAASPSSLEEAVWDLTIESGIMKIPVVLVSFRDIGIQSLYAARLSRQGPGNLGSLFAADPDGFPHTPRIGHEKMLERLAAADNRLEVEEVGLRDITDLLGRLTIQREEIMDASSHANGSHPKKIKESGNEPSNLPTPSESSLPIHSSPSIHRGSSNPTSSV